MQVVILYKGIEDDVIENVKGITEKGNSIVIEYLDEDFGLICEKVELDDDTKLEIRQSSK